MDEPKVRWFFVDDAGNYRGPADLETLSILVEGGVVTPSTQMRREDTDEWASAETFFDFQTTGTPPPLPATEPTSRSSSSSVPDVVDNSPHRSFWATIKLPDAEFRGEMGEKTLFWFLKHQLPIGGYFGYRIVRNLMFETPTGTTQLDFAIVSAFGIFIVEAKNYRGWIFGDPSQPRWTQALKGGRKFQFQNPIRQNFKHVAVLSEKTGIPQNLIFPVVAFSPSCVFKTEMPVNVMHFIDVPDYIKKFNTVVIKPEQLTEVMETFLSWDKDIDSEKKRNHVQNLKEAHAPAPIDARNVLCPVCGNRMVLRHGKGDRPPFWGCSKYPGCKGIRAVSGL